MGGGADCHWDVLLARTARGEALSGFAKREVLMAAWTTKELRELHAVHVNGARPTMSSLFLLLPRHTAKSIKATCFAQGLRRKYPAHLAWLRRAHAYFAERERLWIGYRN